jgi:hypothetical protein
MGKLPWFAFYPNDWLTDGVSQCSLAAQGLWLRLMIVMHRYSERYGFLEMDGKAISEERAAIMCGATLTEYQDLMSELKAAGVPSFTAANVLFSRRMVRDSRKREKTAARVAKFNAKDNAALNAVDNAGANGEINATEVQNIREERSSYFQREKSGWVDREQQRLDRSNQAIKDVVREARQKASGARRKLRKEGHHKDTN